MHLSHAACLYLVSKQSSLKAKIKASLLFINGVKPYLNLINNQMTYEMNHILNCGYENQVPSYDPRSYERNFSNCVEECENFRTSTEFELVTSRDRCDVGFIAQLVRKSHRYRAVAGSNPVKS